MSLSSLSVMHWNTSFSGSEHSGQVMVTGVAVSRPRVSNWSNSMRTSVLGGVPLELIDRSASAVSITESMAAGVAFWDLLDWLSSLYTSCCSWVQIVGSVTFDEDCHVGFDHNGSLEVAEGAAGMLMVIGLSDGDACGEEIASVGRVI